MQRKLGYAGVFATTIAGMAAATRAQPLPPPPQPPANVTTEAKRVLGKILFFDEQMSLSNTVSCATCHVNGRGGGDPHLVRNPGPDGVFNTPDDRFASAGVVRADVSNDYVRDALFGLGAQVTSRAANSPINAAYAGDVFWDGRARSQFVDPETGQVAIQNGGGLESQVVNPPVSAVEMAHDGVVWNDVKGKLARVRPLDLATNIPADVSAALVGGPGYPELFRRAFGDTQITARRIAFAIASYERTLISNQSPWDSFVAGVPGALTPQQDQGRLAFQGQCAVCHTPPFFSNQTFRNIGLRPPDEDLGRQLVTGIAPDRGRFKVPSVRNAGLKASFMHNGQFTTLQQVIDFYARAPGAAQQFPDNRDPLIPAINLPGPVRAQVDDFVRNALTDPRVANQTFPFDRATLFTERAGDRATIVGAGSAGSGGFVPQIMVLDPAMVGNLDFRIGLNGTLGGATATLGISSSEPANGVITPERMVGAVIASSGGAGQGVGTLHWPLSWGEATGGQVIYAQWFVADASAVGGMAHSPVAKIPVFCGSMGCPPVCGYANCDGSTVPPVINVNDFSCFLNRFAAGDAYANCDGSTIAPVLNVNDFSCFMNKFAVGCQ